MGLAKEGGTLIGVVAELMAEDAEGAHGIAETAGDVARGLFIDDEGAERFVLALHGELWGKEELVVGGSNYLIHRTGRHTEMMLQKHSMVKTFWRKRTSRRVKKLLYRHTARKLCGVGQGRSRAGCDEIALR
jgi:hypothetical protein